MRFNKVLLKQENESDCGKSALRMLLSYVHKSETYLTVPLESQSDNFLALKKIAERYGVKLEGKKISEITQLKQLTTPFIAQTSSGGVNHFVFCVVKGNKLLINDPSGETFVLSLKRMQELIFTNVLVVEEVSKFKKPAGIKIKHRLSAFIFEVLFVLLIGVGFLFLGNNDLSLVSYISFTLAAIAKVIEQQVVIRSFTAFDQQYITPIITEAKELKKKDFVALQNAKQIVFSLPLTLFTRLLSVLLITVILAYNNYYLLIICLFTIIGALILTKSSLTKHEGAWALKNYETKLFTSSNEVRRENYQKLLSETNKVAKKQIYYSVIAHFVIAAIIFLLMFVTGSFTLNYFLFYFFTFTYYFSELKKIFNLIEDKSSYYMAQNTIFNRKK